MFNIFAWFEISHKNQLKVFAFVLSYDKILNHQKVLTTTYPINERQKK